MKASNYLLRQFPSSRPPSLCHTQKEKKKKNRKTSGKKKSSKMTREYSNRFTNTRIYVKTVLKLLCVSF